MDHENEAYIGSNMASPDEKVEGIMLLLFKDPLGVPFTDLVSL